MVMGKSRRGVGLVESGVERPDQRRDLGQPLLRTGWAKEKKLAWTGRVGNGKELRLVGRVVGAARRRASLRREMNG